MLTLDGDQFRQAPEWFLGKICTALNLSAVKGLSSWPNGRIRQWKPHEQQSQAKWHQTLEASNGIIPSPTVAPDEPVIDDAKHRLVLDNATVIYEDLIKENMLLQEVI